MLLKLVEYLRENKDDIVREEQVLTESCWNQGEFITTYDLRTKVIEVIDFDSLLYKIAEFAEKENGNG